MVADRPRTKLLTVVRPSSRPSAWTISVPEREKRRKKEGEEIRRREGKERRRREREKRKRREGKDARRREG